MKKISFLILLGLSACKEDTTSPDLTAGPYKNCKVVSTSSKSANANGTESITANGQTIKVGPPTVTSYTFDAAGLLLKEQIEDGGVLRNQSTYTYDSEGRVLTRRIESFSGEGWTQTKYSYTAATIEIEIQRHTGQITKTTSKLNSKGQLESTGDTFFTYDLEGNTIQSKSPNQLLTWKYTGGNLVAYHWEASNAPYTVDITYKHDLSHPAIPIYGTKDKNLINSQETIEKDAQGNPTRPIAAETYTYEFDAQERVTRKITSSGNQVRSVTEYTYDCK